MMLLNAIHIGDALATLKKFPSDSVHCIVTSPPYFALRDYGVPGQLGLEQAPDEYLDKLVAIFREARRVLRHDGTCWVNMGDSYAGSGKRRNPKNSERAGYVGNRQREQAAMPTTNKVLQGYKPKDLMLIPFRLALALQADGWRVRQTNIWHKPSCMPQSVTDRTTTDFEYVFHLAKNAHYWYDADAIREPSARPGDTNTFGGSKIAALDIPDNDPRYRGETGQWGRTIQTPTTRNKRSVWTIPSEPYSDAHFATFPQALPELCIAAGCPATCCAKCGAGYVRVTEVDAEYQALKDKRKGALDYQSGGLARGSKFSGATPGLTKQVHTLGFKPACTCDTTDTLPGVVLDMFGGAGTVALAARHLGRDYVLIELNPRYVEMAQKRIKNYDPLQPTEFKDGSRQLSLFGEAV